jgi:RNA polymerase sigma factor (sigma-70 family)
MSLPPFSTFLEDHRVDVYRYLTALVGPDRADDCFQETFLAALRAYPRLHPGANLRAWILTIAARKAIDDGRGRARRPLPLGDLPERSTPPVSDGEPELWRAVRNLPPKQRDALVHRYVLDLSYREVGQALGCSEEAARASAHEGRRRLQRELALIGHREEET